MVHCRYGERGRDLRGVSKMRYNTECREIIRPCLPPNGPHTFAWEVLVASHDKGGNVKYQRNGADSLAAAKTLMLCSVVVATAQGECIHDAYIRGPDFQYSPMPPDLSGISVRKLVADSEHDCPDPAKVRPG